MKAVIEKFGDIAACKVEGEININSIAALRQHLEEIVKQGHKKTIIDFSTVNYIDSAGLAAMIEFMQRLQRGGGNLRLCSLNKQIKSVFEVTKLNTLFSIFDTLDNAKQGF